MAESMLYRRRFYQGNLVFLVLVIGVLVLLNLTADKTSALKLDLTKDQLYSISPAAQKILTEKLKDNVRVTYYSSEGLSTVLVNLLRDTVDMFEEFRKLSGGKFQYEVVDPEAQADAYALRQTEEYLRQKGAGKEEDLEEPEPPQSLTMLFSQRKRPTPQEIREARDRRAAEIAKARKEPKEEIYRELLLEEWKQKYFKDLQQQQISPYILADRTASSVRQAKVYSSITLTYLDKQPELIPFHTSLEGLEYELAHLLLKLTNPEKPTVAFFDGRKPPAPEFNPMNPMNPTPPPGSEYQAVIQQVLGELFDVRELGLKEGDDIDATVKRIRNDRERRERELKGEEEPSQEEKDRPVTEDEIREYLKCLVIAQPEGLEERQIYEINRVVSLGVPTIFLVSPYSMDVSQEGVARGIPVATIHSGLDELFRKWGLELGTEMLASNQQGGITLRVPRNLGGLRLMVNQFTPIAAIVAPTGEAVDREHALLNNLPQLVFPATAGLKLVQGTLEKNGLKARELARTGEQSWSVRVDPFERLQNPILKQQGPGISLSQYQEDLVQYKDPQEFTDWVDPVPLAAYVEGKAPFIYEGESVPEWKKEEKKEGEEDDGDDDKDALLNLDDPLAPAEEGAAAGGGEGAGSGAGEAPAGEAAPAGGESPGDQTPAEGTEAGAEEKEPAKPKAHLEPREDGRILVLASVDMFKNDFLVNWRDFPAYQYNIDFLQNAIELFGLDRTLVQIRRKALTVNQFKPGSDRQVWWVRGLNLFGVPLLVAVIGLVRFLLRRSESIRYERRYIETHEARGLASSR